MSKLTPSEVLHRIVVRVLELEHPSELETDNVGQLIVYTGIFRWKDGICRDAPEPEHET